ncbi:DUF3306 domain-containing protein [Nisaea nitritireducens]|uniref:DUF3306 domain-containing protein n=1 Tax=Nisaea nitritireducens TaxID=568392 RepID=UPI001D028B9B|nr:DUF3306 domain-containing protein [Nisaea nitritireducens]
MTDTQDDDGRGFLARWSQRKDSARIAETATPREKRGGAAPVLPEEAPDDQLPALITGDERPLTEEEQELVDGLPDIETLDAESDFTPFMQSKVPEFLRRRALQALWRTNPVLANVDGLVDYGGDFTDSAMVIEGMQTAYRVGKGFMTDEELAEKPDEEDAQAEDTQTEDTEAEDELADDEARRLAAAEQPEAAANSGSAAGSGDDLQGEDEAEEVGDGDLE